MKITKSQLKQIIKEEMESVVQEQKDLTDALQSALTKTDNTASKLTEDLLLLCQHLLVPLGVKERMSRSRPHVTKVQEGVYQVSLTVTMFEERARAVPPAAPRRGGPDDDDD